MYNSANPTHRSSGPFLFFKTYEHSSEIIFVFARIILNFKVRFRNSDDQYDFIKTTTI